jgi:hypothetical protein
MGKAANAGVASSLKGINLQKEGVKNQAASGLRDNSLSQEELEARYGINKRDVGLAEDQAMKSNINNALSRGIYRSGIRTSNEREINEAADRELADLATFFKFDSTKLANQAADLKRDMALALRVLANQASGVRAGAAGTNKQYEIQGQLAAAEIATANSNYQSELINTYGGVYNDMYYAPTGVTGYVPQPKQNNPNTYKAGDKRYDHQ